MAGILEVVGEAVALPMAGSGNAKEIFDQLCASFGFDSKIAYFLVETEGLETIDDFIQMFTDASQIEPRLIDKITDLDKKARNASRV